MLCVCWARAVAYPNLVGSFSESVSFVTVGDSNLFLESSPSPLLFECYMRHFLDLSQFCLYDWEETSKCLCLLLSFVHSFLLMEHMRGRTLQL
jgi:hypothetical protein